MRDSYLVTMLIEKTLSSGEKVKLLSSGSVFFHELENLIDSAKEEIHFQVYIFEDDATGHRIADAFLRAASRGVKIYLFIDAFGSSLFPEKRLNELKKAGVKIKFFGPILRGGRLHIGRRLHRKVIVFDRERAIVTGLNISNNYNDISPSTPKSPKGDLARSPFRGLGGRVAWLDFAVIVEGDIVMKLYAMCLQRWMKKSIRQRLLNRKSKILNYKSKHGLIHLRQNDWIRGLNEANASYRREIQHAQQSLFIVGGYFLPGGRVRKMLARAVERGVNIQIILAAKSDVKLQHFAIQYLYQWMIRNGIKIYEYLPSNVHGKVLIADKRLVSIGSYDLNNLSTFSNVELNLDINDASFASAFQSELEKIAEKDCRLITVEELYKRSNLWKRFKYWNAYQFTKSLFVLSLWLARKDEEEYQ
jgi:cardiolipin synthase